MHEGRGVGVEPDFTTYTKQKEGKIRGAPYRRKMFDFPRIVEGGSKYNVIGTVNILGAMATRLGRRV